MTRRATPSIALVALALLASCRDCNSPASTDESGSKTGALASGQHPLPPGMLVPMPLGSDGGRSIVDRLRLSTGERSGEWYELQPAASDAADESAPARWSARSRFVSPQAMSLLSEALARATHHFTPFAPTYVAPPELKRTQAELEVLRGEWIATQNLASAKTTWGMRAPFVAELTTDTEWIAVRSAFASTLDALISFTLQTETARVGLWLLPN